MRRATTSFLIGVLVQAKTGFAPLTRSTAMECLADIQSASKAFERDFAFDVNCNENRDRFCYDYCMTYCALPSKSLATPQYCEDHLPPGCEAQFGGVHLVKFRLGERRSAWHLEDEVNSAAWTFNGETLAKAARKLLTDRDVEFTDVYLGVAPTAEEQTWVASGASEVAINEGALTGNLCAKVPNVPSAITSRYLTLDVTGALSEFAGAVETRGAQGSGMYVAKRGWKLWQQYVGQWESELLKRFWMLPMSTQFVLNDARFPSQFAQDALLLLQDFEPCAGITGADQSLVAFFVWGRRVHGKKAPGQSREYADYIDAWGWPVPRSSESCQHATNCEACEMQTTTSGQKCRWCMTAMGQTCHSVCDDSFNTPLPCS